MMNKGLQALFNRTATTTQQLKLLGKNMSVIRQFSPATAARVRAETAASTTTGVVVSDGKLDASKNALGAASEMHQKSMTDGSAKIYDKWPDYTEDMLSIGYTGFHKTAKKALNVCDRGNWLDAGAGSGLVGKSLWEQKSEEDEIRLYGCDLSQAQLDQIEDRAPNVYYQTTKADLHQPLPFNQNFFDAILSSGVFLQGHVDKEALLNLVDVLKPGGKMVFTVRQHHWETKDFDTYICNHLNVKVLEKELTNYLDGVVALIVTVQKNYQ